MLIVAENPAEVAETPKQGFGIEPAFSVRPVEITMPLYPPLKGFLTAQVYEGNQLSNGVVRTDQELTIRVHWWLEGALARCLCGYWCLELFMESIGSGPELVIPHTAEKYIPLDPCGNGHYYKDIKIPAHYIRPEHCSIPYYLVVGLTYRTPCKDKHGQYEPGPMAGFCKLGVFQFYESVK